MFGDQIGFSQVSPYNTVQFGGYLIHELDNLHNWFDNPVDGPSGARHRLSEQARILLRLLPTGQRNIFCSGRCSSHSADSYHPQYPRGRFQYQL